MKIFLTKYILKYILQKKCGYSVPRSGKEGEAVNCFNTYLFFQGKPYMVVTQVLGNELAGKLLSNKGFVENGTIEYNQLNNYRIKITHHYGLYDIEYDGLIDYFFTGLTKINETKCNLHKIFNNTKQFFFNRKKLATFDRIEVLRALIELKLNGGDEKFMTMDLMTQLYSLRWIMHPNGQSQENRLQLFVDSFIESGELSSENGFHYSVTGKAINTLSKYEEQERRHLENTDIQKRMLWLTFSIVSIGILQAFITYIKP